MTSDTGGPGYRQQTRDITEFERQWLAENGHKLIPAEQQLDQVDLRVENLTGYGNTRADTARKAETMNGRERPGREAAMNAMVSSDDSYSRTNRIICKVFGHRFDYLYVFAWGTRIEKCGRCGHQREA